MDFQWEPWGTSESCRCGAVYKSSRATGAGPTRFDELLVDQSKSNRGNLLGYGVEESMVDNGGEDLVCPHDVGDNTGLF